MLPKDDPRQTDAFGIDRYFQDAYGEWHETPRQTRRAILDAMGMDGDEPNVSTAPVLFMRPGRPACLISGPGRITLESGERLEITGGALPANLPFGYHTLETTADDQPVRLIVSPERCYLPQDLKTWGWSVQLYALRSRESQGIGDLADLKHLAEWSSAELGAGMLMINPLSAASPVLPQQPSPYYPSSRQFRNPLYLRVPGLESGFEELNRRRLIDRDAVFRLKMDALWKQWRRLSPWPEFTADADLHRFATYCALAERFGGGYPGWPAEYQNPNSPAVACFARENADRVGFHCWLQMLLDEQLADASYALPLMQDLPIGVDGGGADAWAWQSVFARGISVGAPPDKFNTQGQDWGLPPFIPHPLRQAGYEPFIQTIRATLKHAGGLRIDHVPGLFRLYWVPQGLGPAQGTYVRYQSDELLAIVALESWRARAFVVGEDLGTVEPGVSETLQRNGILSYRVFWFEEKPPETYPEMALAAISTHDLPTVAGLWTGSDLRRQHQLGLKPNDAETEASRQRLRKMCALPKTATVTDAVLGVHKLLARAPSCVVAAQLDDVLGVEERPNIPATTGDQNPNWSLALPKTLEEIMRDPVADQVARMLVRRTDP